MADLWRAAALIVEIAAKIGGESVAPDNQQ
jgi:hypothetical protein